MMFVGGTNPHACVLLLRVAMLSRIRGDKGAVGIWDMVSGSKGLLLLTCGTQ